MISPPNSTVLIAPDASDLRSALQNCGFHVITWPTVDVQRPRTSVVLDEAIENLYGYDWVIFVNEDSVHFFLERLGEHGQDVSDLDSLAVCAIGEHTAATLEQMRVHVDVFAKDCAAHKVVDSLTTYLGGQHSLRSLNFLIPQAVIGRDYLRDHLEEAGGRADVVAVYQTVPDADMTRLLALQTILQTGSIDAVVFSRQLDMENFARLFGTKDLAKLLRNTNVVVSCDEDAKLAEAFGVAQVLKPTDSGAATLPATLADYLA